MAASHNDGPGCSASSKKHWEQEMQNGGMCRRSFELLRVGALKLVKHNHCLSIAKQSLHVCNPISLPLFMYGTFREGLGLVSEQVSSTSQIADKAPAPPRTLSPVAASLGPSPDTL
jgi:hypothetical protein